MRVKTTGHKRTTYSVALTYKNILDMLRSEGAKIEGNVNIDIDVTESNSSFNRKLGSMKSPIQRLILQVTVREDY